MDERPGTETQYSRRLPPPDAWKQPDRWINLETGLALQERSRLEILFDDRGLIRTDATVQRVKDELFWDDYDWPYRPEDCETRPDEHHFYYEAEEYSPDSREGDTVAWRFRALPTHIGWMPRQFHNTLHDFTPKPPMPEYEVMEDYLASYMLALQSFKRLYATAKNSISAEQKFAMRQRTLLRGGLVPMTVDDRVGDDYNRTFFDNHFRSYAEAVTAFRGTEYRHLIDQDFGKYEVARRKRVVKKMGRIITRKHVNYVPMLRGAEAA